MRKQFLSLVAVMPFMTFAAGSCAALSELENLMGDEEGYPAEDAGGEYGYDDGSGSMLGDIASNTAWLNSGAGDWSSRP